MGGGRREDGANGGRGAWGSWFREVRAAELGTQRSLASRQGVQAEKDLQRRGQGTLLESRARS